ncbi:hypothetical protein LXL04_003932 [Taraxacum kok-saghyz]
MVPCLSQDKWGTRAMRRRQFYSANGFVSGNRATSNFFSKGRTVNVQIEKSGTIFGFRGCASVPSESESTREDSQSILLEFNGEGGNWLKGFRGCASVPSESESTREEVYWCRRNGGESQC